MNSFDGPLGNGLGKLSGLQRLDLSHNRFSGSIRVQLQRLHNLRTAKPEHVSLQSLPFENKKQQAYNIEADLRAMCEERRLKDAVDYLKLVYQGCLQPLPSNFLYLLQECANFKSISDGMKVHTLLVESGMKLDIGLNNHLLSMYVKCGSIREAWSVFQDMRGRRDVVSWTTMIHAYAEQLNRRQVFRIFHAMQCKKVKPNKITFVCMLKACSSSEALQDGKIIHGYISERQLNSNIHVGGALVEMYLRCGGISCAWKALNKIEGPSLSLWNAVIEGCLENGQESTGLKIFQQMLQSRVGANEAIIANVVKCCSNLLSLQGGRWLHSYVNESNLEFDATLRRCLTEMYVTCRSLEDAQNLLGEQVSAEWEALLIACNNHVINL